MKHFIFILMLLLFASYSGVCANNKLSEQAEISLISCSPGDVLYLAFGHSAVRVSDSVNGFDYVYNYGTFDFDTPNFYLKFARGQLKYMLSRTEFRRFLAVYKYENRTVKQQTLNLNLYQKQTLFNLLEQNNTPENRFYNYDFYFDNCASRIRDVIEKALEKQLKFKSNSDSLLSFRQLTDLYVDQQQPWGDFGIDLALGVSIDRTANYREQMFYPII